MIYVGDNLNTDALLPAAAGLVDVWLNRQNQPDADPPIHTIRSLSDVRSLIAARLISLRTWEGHAHLVGWSCCNGGGADATVRV